MSRNNLRRTRPHAFQINECHAYHFHALHPYGVLPRVESVDASQAPERRTPRTATRGAQWRTLFGRAVRRRTVAGVVERLGEQGVPVTPRAVYNWVTGGVRPSGQLVFCPT